jgi:hypothetical protein
MHKFATAQGNETAAVTAAVREAVTGAVSRAGTEQEQDKTSLTLVDR